MSSESAPVAISVTDEALDSVDETQATAEPEAKPKAAAATPEASPESSSRDAQPSPVPASRASFLAAGRARIPKLWYTLVAAGHGAATFDAWSTRRVIGSGNGRELDPLMRPFAHSSAIYGAIQVGPGLLDYLARRMMRSEKRWVRRLWWLPQAAGTAGSLWSGAHNLRLASR